MASFQIGQPGVSAFLQSLLRHLHVVLEMDHFFQVQIEMELKEMEKLLLGFECVLLDGERKRQHGVKDAERWMHNLKDLFYDIDDLLDDVKMEKQHSKVRTYNQKDGFSTQENIKERLGPLLEMLRKRTEEVINPLQLKRDAVQHDSVWLESQAMVRPKQGCYADEPAIHGREEDKKRIIERLLADDGGERRRNYEFVCVVGMGGLGKTTLAQLVFQDESVKRFFAVRSWACISDVFDVSKVTQDLIESASERGDGAANMPSALAALQDRLKETINDKKFLLVLDDVWMTKELEQLKIPLNFGAKGSKILVTTRLSEVAEVLRNREPYRLEPLEYAQCLKIFNDNAFGEDDETDNDRGLMKIAEEIVRKCKGVPLVAKVIGAMLRGKDNGEWKAVKDDGIWDLAYKDGDLHPGLRLSYFYLPPHLKRCFEYFALFPTDFKFDQREVVRMWMAEGLIEVKEGRELEEIGNQYYSDLKGRSLIQEDNKMHDMLHHLACIVSDSPFLCGFSGSSSSTSSPHCGRHAFTREVRIDASKLRTLIDGGELGQELLSYKRLRVLGVHKFLSHLPRSLGSDLKHLRYLNLTGKCLNGTLPDSICTLTTLQVLDLSYCENVENLPLDIGELSNLRFLGLRRSRITGLPDSIRMLTNLQELDLSGCVDLKNLPDDVGNLLNLRFLRLQRSGITVLRDSIRTLLNLRFLGLEESKITILPDSICTLTNLQELDLSGCRNLKNLPEDVGKLLNLRFLRLQRSGITVLRDSIRTLLNLRFLGLEESKITILPDSICTLTNLQELDLSRCRNLKNLPEDVGKLLNLRFLRLQHSGITVLPDSVCSLLNLQVLDLADCESLTTLPNDMGNLQSLHELRLDGSSISCLPNSVVNATNLRVLRINADVDLPAHIGKLTKLEELGSFCVGKEKGRGIDELKGMNRLQGSLTIFGMENIESAEKASMANLRSKKHIEELKFVWKAFGRALKGRDGKMEVRVMEALEPNAAIKSLLIENYVGHKFPSWSTPPLHNLTELYLNSLPLMAELTGMEFESLLVLELDYCYALREVSVTTPQLETLTIMWCNELIAVKLSPRLDKLSIFCCPKLRNLPYGLHDLTSLRKVYLTDCPCLEIRPDDPLPPSITDKCISGCPKLDVQGVMEREEEWNGAFGLRLMSTFIFMITIYYLIMYFSLF